MSAGPLRSDFGFSAACGSCLARFPLYSALCCVVPVFDIQAAFFLLKSLPPREAFLRTRFLGPGWIFPHLSAGILWLLQHALILRSLLVQKGTSCATSLGLQLSVLGVSRTDDLALLGISASFETFTDGRFLVVRVAVADHAYGPRRDVKPHPFRVRHGGPDAPCESVPSFSHTSSIYVDVSNSSYRIVWGNRSPPRICVQYCP